MTNLKSQSHQGRPIEFSVDENGRLGIEFNDYSCAYRYMDGDKARELRDWLNLAFPVEPTEEQEPCVSHLAMKEYEKALQCIAAPVYLNLNPAYADPHNVKAICDGLNDRIAIAQAALDGSSENRRAQP